MKNNLKKIVIFYKSKYGSTKRYAEWISKGLDAEVFELSKFDSSQLDKYDVVLFGSSVHTGKIRHINFIKQNWYILYKKQVIVFTATGAPSDSPSQKKILEASLPVEIRSKVAYYPLHGAYDYNKLDWLDKLLMNGSRIKLLASWWFKKDKKSKEQLDKFYVPHDWANEKAVYPIIALAKNR